MSSVDPEIVYFLRRVRWLRGLSFEELSMMAALLRQERHPPGVTIIRQGEEGKRFYVLHEGEARVELVAQEGVRILSRLSAGDNFGESALVSGQPRGASVITETECVVYAMERDDFELMLRRSSSFAQGLLKSLGSWVCRQGATDDDTLSSPVAVTRLTGGAPEERAALGVALSIAMGEDLSTAPIPLLWADDGAPPPWCDAESSQGSVDGTLSRYATGDKRVIVLGGDEGEWKGETDFRVLLGEAMPSRDASGQRGVSILSTAPRGPVDWSSALYVGRLGELVQKRGRVSRGDPGWAKLMRLARTVSSRRVGIALGGGGAWGLASVGVIRALHRLGLPVDLVAGTSAGAIVGAAYCAAGEAGLQRVIDAFAIRLRTLLPLFRGAIGGFIVEDEVKRLMTHFIPDRSFHALETPFYSVAYSVSSGEQTVLGDGSLVDAVAASNAMPFLLSPVTRKGQALVDGGFSNNVPASVVYGKGADFIIGVDVIPGRVVSEGGSSPFTLPVIRRLDTSMAAIYALLHEASKGYTYLADVIIEPPLAGVNWFNYNRAEEIAGRAEDYVMTQCSEEIMSAFKAFNAKVV